MKPYGQIYEILDGPKIPRRICLALLFDNLFTVREFSGSGFFAHPAVVGFRTAVETLTANDPAKIAELQKDCRMLWPDDVPDIGEIIPGPGHNESDDEPESPILAKAYDYLKEGLISEVTALQIACIIRSEEQGSPDVKTSDVTTLLRAAGYKVPNPAALIRSLADRAEPAIEVMEEKIGPRQELQFRLLPEVAADLKRRLLGKSASAA